MANITLKRYDGGWDTLNPQTTWNQITSKPTTFTPTSHTHTLSQISDAGTVAAVNLSNNTSHFLRGDGTFTTISATDSTKLPLTGGTLTGTLTTRAINMQNFNLSGVGVINFNDPGVNEGINWSNIKLYESPDNLTNASGNFQVATGSTRLFTVRTNGDVDIPDGSLSVSTNVTIGGSEAITRANRDDVYSFHDASDLAVGWYTIATNSGSRAIGKFGLRDTDSSRHQSVIFYAAHHYGNDDSNTITVLHNSRFGTSPFRYIRIKDGGTYDGAALQIYIDNAQNNVRALILADNFQSSGWVLRDWVGDALDPGVASNWSSFTEKSKIDLDQIDQGGIATTGPIYAGGNTTQYRVLTTENEGSGGGIDADTVDGIHASSFFTASNIPANIFDTYRRDTIDSASEDFDDFTTSGTYAVNQWNASGDVVANGPTNTSAGDAYPWGMLRVTNFQSSTGTGNGYIVQEYIPHNGDVMFMRFQWNGTWTGWRNYWGNENDGSGSNLDADKLDGYHASSFLRSDGTDSASGNLTFGGQTTFNSKVTIDTGTSTDALVLKGTSPTITFSDDTSGADDFFLHANSNNFYILTDRDGNDNVGAGYETPHPLQLEADTNTGYLFGNRILTTADEGSGNGIDADTLDGITSGSFLRSNADDIYTGTLTLGTNTTIKLPNSAQYGIRTSTGHRVIDSVDATLRIGDTGKHSLITLHGQDNDDFKVYYGNTHYTIYHEGNKPSAGDVGAAAASHTHAANAITSGEFNTARLGSGTATSGYVLQSDGDGTASWAAASSGGSGNTWTEIKTGVTTISSGTAVTNVSLTPGNTVDDTTVLAIELNTGTLTSYTSQIFIVKLEDSDSEYAGILYNAGASSSYIRTGSVRVFRTLSMGPTSTSISFTDVYYHTNGSSSETADTIYVGKIWKLGVTGS